MDTVTTGTLNGAALDKPAAPEAAVAAPDVLSKPEPPPPAPVVKPVNPLRLARPLEKGQGLSKTAIPHNRPMPMPTISPLCPPGAAAAKNGTKPLVSQVKNGTSAEPVKPSVPVSQPLKATTPQPREDEKVAEPAKQETPAPAPPAPAPTPAVAPVPAPTPTPATVLAPAPSSTPAPAAPEKESADPKPVVATKPADAPPAPAPVPVLPKKAAAAEPVAPPKEEEEEEVPAPTSLPETKTKKAASPQKGEGPKVPVAEKTPRQKKRKASQEVAPLPDDEKRLSKRARAPPTIYEAPDPEMAQILKTIKKQEEEEGKRTSTSDKEEEKEEEKEEKKVKEKPKEKAKEKPKEKAKNKPKLLPKRKEQKKSIVEDSDSDLDEPPSPKPTPRSRVKKPVAKAKVAPANKKGDPVFFKDEYMAVRNAEGSFYICKAMQNIFMGSKNIKIQWLSNEDSVIPAKDNPDGDIYAHDFYDKTEFETILTSVELEKTLGKSKRMIMPEEELERINKILKRAQDKANGTLDMSDLLTEDNPDGLDISLYKGEDQLDEIDRKRKGEEEKSEKKSEKKPAEKKPVKKKEIKQKVEKEVKDEIDIKPEAKKKVVKAKESVKEKEKSTEPAEKREGRRAAKNISYDTNQFDFLEEDDDEVMPLPKKRKSQDSVAEDTKPEPKVATPTPAVQTEEKKIDVEESKPEELSTSEKAVIAEKAKMESDAAAKEEESNSVTSETQQPAKKRGRKPKGNE